MILRKGKENIERRLRELEDWKKTFDFLVRT